MEAALRPYPSIMNKIKKRATDLWKKYEVHDERPHHSGSLLLCDLPWIPQSPPKMSCS